MPTPEQLVLELFLPKGVLEWFEVSSGSNHDGAIHVVLEEKNIPPIEKDSYTKILSHGFKEITITDFPIRGKRALLTFRRRYWKMEGQKELLKRDIQLVFPGTQLETEFATFLKEGGGRTTGLAGFYRSVSLPPGEGI